ncbi:metallophosphoesterase [Chitinispirillum alkaliphilum]|nr:metallophosphoesterase [Chitinispirillum alkaliphilum]
MADIDSCDIDQVFCLGDIVGYGANPNECVEMVMERCSVTIRGNHDAAALDVLSAQQFNINAKIAIEWTAKELKSKNKKFLQSLPVLEDINDTLTLVHSTPYEPDTWHYISSLEEAAFNFQFFLTPVCFMGHTHMPAIVVMDRDGEIFVHQDKEIEFDKNTGTRLLVNVGSVGQSRDRNPKACYGVFDTENGLFYFRRVEYNIEKTQSKMRRARMPDFLVHRIAEGR